MNVNIKYKITECPEQAIEKICVTLGLVMSFDTTPKVTVNFKF